MSPTRPPPPSPTAWDKSTTPGKNNHVAPPNESLVPLSVFRFKYSTKNRCHFGTRFKCNVSVPPRASRSEAAALCHTSSGVYNHP